jgi:hypothetical protein
MSNVKPKGQRLCFRCPTSSRRVPMITLSSLISQRLMRRSSLPVQKTRSAATRPIAVKERSDKVDVKPMKLNKTTHVRVVPLDKLQDSPDHRATMESEVYKEYSNLPLDKENITTLAPLFLMNEVLLSTRTPRRLASPPVRRRAWWSVTHATYQNRLGL